MLLFVATSLRNVQFAFLSQGELSLRNQFNVVFNRKVSDTGWLYFRNSYEKGLSLSLDRAADEQWSQHKRGQFSCSGDQDGSDCNRDFWKGSCGFLQTSQPGLLSVEKRKKLYSESEIQHRFSLIIIILQLLLSTSLCSGSSSPPLSLQTLLQSRSASPLGHQQTECSPLWIGYNSLWLCCDAVNKFSLPNKPPHLNPYFQLLGSLFHWNMELSMQSSLVLKLMVSAIKTTAAIIADTDLFHRLKSESHLRAISFQGVFFYSTFWLPSLIRGLFS